MDTLNNDIKKILKQLQSEQCEDFQYSEKSLDSGIQTSRTIKCFKNTKDYSVYISRFKSQNLDTRDFIRIIVEIPCQNNLRSKNIETVMFTLKKLESFFVYIDYVKLYYGDGLIHLDCLRENKFR